MTWESDSKEGWHRIGDGRLEVYVDESGHVVRGTFNGIIPVYPYRSVNGGWERYEPRLSALRAELKKGTTRMM